MLYPKMAREAGHYFETWVARLTFLLWTTNPCVQVPSSIEGPGRVAAEAIFDRVEQIDFLFTRRGRRWRAYTSEDQLGANNGCPLTILDMESLLFPSIATASILLQSILSIYNLILQLLYTNIKTWLLSTQWNVISLPDCWIWNTLKDISSALQGYPDIPA